jgi:hypothetical protein
MSCPLPVTDVLYHSHSRTIPVSGPATASYSQFQVGAPSVRGSRRAQDRTAPRAWLVAARQRETISLTSRRSRDPFCFLHAPLENSPAESTSHGHK